MNDYFNFLYPCLVPFECRFVENSTVIYQKVNSEYSHIDILEDFSYISFDVNDNITQQHKLKLFYAESYGGGGIGSHGGGARCGYDGNLLQIKGIGKNPLTSNKSDVNGQKDGILLLSSAIYEMLWSHILDDFLPYGSTPCIAIIVVDANNLIGKKIEDCRALLIRKVALRPAHLERAPYFKKKLKYAPVFVSNDVDRVASMHKRLYFLFATIIKEDENNSPLNFINYIILFSLRQASQLAFSISNLIYHSVSSSNISLNGSWLDFTSTSTISLNHHSNSSYFREFFLSLLNQSNIIKSTLHSIIFYHAKYLHLSNDYYLKSLNIANYYFNRNYRAEMIFNLLCIAGADKKIARRLVNHKSAIVMFKTLRRTIENIFLRNDIHHDKNINIVNYAFIFLSFHPNFREVNFINDVSLNDYNKIRVQMLQIIMDEYKRENISDKCVNKLFAITSARLAGWKTELSYSNIMKSINSVITRHDVTSMAFKKAVSALIENINLRAKFRLDYANNNTTLCWLEKRFSLTYIALANKFSIKSTSKTLEFTPGADFYQFLISNKRYRKMVIYYARLKSTSVFL